MIFYKMINKANFECGTDNIEISLPIVKVDKENRIVSGFATLDNSDNHNDIITADASMKAFQRWRGNVREMHQPIAVGKALDFKEEEFYDAQTDNMYRGVFVSVYVSKGAEDTWQKVLDGTLTGFSIGGSIIEKSEYENEKGEQGRKILDYELKELSLVDSPANKLANIMSIQKKEDGTEEVKGMAVNVETQNVYYCKEDAFAFTSKDNLDNCRGCGNELENIGWVENTIDKHAAVKDLIKRATTPDNNMYISSGGDDEFYLDVQGGVDNMTKTEKKTEEESVEKDDAVEETAESAEEVEETEQTEETEKSEAANVDEVEDDGPDLNKVLEQINSTVQKAVEDASTKAAESANEVNEDVKKSLGELRDEVKSVKDDLDGVKSKVSKFEDGGAVQKSSDITVDTSEDDEQESFWRGQFLDAESLRS